jgi:hypothetical protein
VVRGDWSIDEVRDGKRDATALLRAYNAAGGELDDTCDVILAHADLEVVARLLLSAAQGLAERVAVLEGCGTEDEIRDAIEKRVVFTQAELIAEAGAGESPG